MVATELRATLFHGFSDRSRLRIIEALTGGELRVSDIVDATGLTQSNASTHLACLWDCGLVARERHGREVLYRLIDGVADCRHEDRSEAA
jgi:DNA-binding transcriptional ArsR family regulator